MCIKSPTSFEEQLNKIKSRGCIVQDDSFALEVLERINYYRLTAYFLPFKTNTDVYKPGTDFYIVYRIHEFDRELRNILLPIIEEIELKLRSQLSYYHSRRYGALGYLSQQNFNRKHQHDRFIQHIEKAKQENRRQLFVEHHIQKYGGKFPLWVIIELFTTGELSYFYSDMKMEDQKVLARTLFDATPKLVRSWLICLTILRNYCAHYSRLYYTFFPATPGLPFEYPYTAGKRVFDYILVLRFLYHNDDRWSQAFIPRIYDVLYEYSDAIRLEYIGFPPNWENILLS